MNLFDINAAVGHWPFRRLPDSSAGGLRALLSRHGIMGAAIANTHGLFYKNCHDANLELGGVLGQHRDYFVGMATLNPLYAAWERDLRYCVEELDLRALRMVPQYHNYALGCAEAVAMARAATELGLPILVPHRLVDPRQHHWLDVERTVGLNEVFSLCRAVPEARIIYTEASVGADELCSAPGGKVRFPGLHVEMSRLGSAYEQQVAELARAIGAERILFVTGAPFKSIMPAVLKLTCADMNNRDKELVATGNAFSLLGAGGDAPREGHVETEAETEE